MLERLPGKLLVGFINHGCLLEVQLIWLYSFHVQQNIIQKDIDNLFRQKASIYVILILCLKLQSLSLSLSRNRMKLLGLRETTLVDYNMHINWPHGGLVAKKVAPNSLEWLL